VGASVFAVLVAAYYVVLGPYLGSTVAGTALLALFTFSVRSSPATSLVPKGDFFFAFC
jgi:palmitoyltransferase